MELPVIVQILIGVALLLFGRMVLWLVLAGFGFIGGMKVAQYFFTDLTQTTKFVISISFGVATALLAMFVQKVVVAIIGLLGGGLLGYTLANVFGWQAPGFPWIAVAIGAVIGIATASMLFRWAVSVFSSVVGAYLVVTGLGLTQPVMTVVFVVLVLIGVAIQSRVLKRFRKPEQS